MRNFFKKALAVIAACAAVSVTAVSAFAESASGTANSAVTSAVSTISADMLATGAAVIPIALGVIGLSLVVRYGVSLFKQTARPGR